jgi:hypothetical protein
VKTPTKLHITNAAMGSMVSDVAKGTNATGPTCVSIADVFSALGELVFVK